MHYVIGQRRKRRRSLGIIIGIAVCVLAILAGTYYLLLTLSPALAGLPTASAKVAPTSSVSSVNTLYIPKIGLILPFLSGDSKVLDKGAWHRWPERGNPQQGGNFILAGHRFSMGLTPSKTRARSPFYHLNKLNVGDAVYVDYASKRYIYKISKHYTVKPSQSEIEAPSEQAKLTIYTCTLKGEADGREVIEAVLDS